MLLPQPCACGDHFSDLAGKGFPGFVLLVAVAACSLLAAAAAAADASASVELALAYRVPARTLQVTCSDYGVVQQPSQWLVDPRRCCNSCS